MNPDLTFYYELDRRDIKTLTKLAVVLGKIHKDEGDLKIKTKARLLNQFKKEINFTSDIITIREGRGKIRITASTPELKKRFESLLKRSKE